MVGIIILNYKNWHETIECVNSIFQTTKIDYKIYAIDNDSPNDSYGQLKEYFGDSEKVVVKKADQNKGYAAGNNIGLELASHECEEIVISNPDITFKEGTIENMINFLNSDHNLGVVGPKIFDENGNIQKYARKPLTFARFVSIKKPFSYFLKNIQNDYLHEGYDYSTNLVFQGMVDGCCFAIKNDVVSTINGFDENTFLFGEEDIIGLKLMNIGKKAGICRHADVIHKGSTTMGKGTSPFTDFHRYVSSYYILVEYVDINMVQRFIVRMINIGGFALRSLFNKEYKNKLSDLIEAYHKIYDEHKKVV